MTRLQARRDTALDTLVRGRHVCFVAAAMIGSAAIGAIASEDASSRASDAAQQGADASRQQLDFARQQYNDWQKRYSPLEQQLVDEASRAGGVDEQNQWAGRAAADTNGAYANAMGQLTRNASRYGINANSGNFQDQMRRNAIDQGAALSGAMTNARFNDFNQGHAFRLDVANHGKGLASNAMSAMGSAAYGLNNAARTSYGMANGIQQGIGQLGNGLYKAGRDAGWWGNPSGGGWVMGSGSEASFAPMGGGAPDPTFGTGVVDFNSAAQPAMDYGLSSGSAQNWLMENSGGPIHGPGTETSDSIPARLSDGEYVLNAEAVRLAGKHNLDALNNRGLQVRAQRQGQPVTVGSPGHQQPLDPRILNANRQRLAAAQQHFADGGVVGGPDPSFPQLARNEAQPVSLAPEQEAQYNAWLNANGIQDASAHDLRGFWAAHAPNPTGQPGVNDFAYPGQTQAFANGGAVRPILEHNSQPLQEYHGELPLMHVDRMQPLPQPGQPLLEYNQPMPYMAMTPQMQAQPVTDPNQVLEMNQPLPYMMMQPQMQAQPVGYASGGLVASQTPEQMPAYANGGLVDNGGNAFSPPGYDMSLAPPGQSQPAMPPAVAQPGGLMPQGAPQPMPPQGLQPAPTPRRAARKGKSRSKAAVKKGGKK